MVDFLHEAQRKDEENKISPLTGARGQRAGGCGKRRNKSAERASNKEQFDYSASGASSQAEEEEMFEREYENPMVFGDYGEEDTPDKRVICPCCRRVWLGYVYDGDTEWESGEESIAGCEPFGNGMCVICAWEKRTKEQMRAYIEYRQLYIDVLKKLLCDRSENAITRFHNAKMLWNVLTDTTDQNTQEWTDSLIDDYIAEEGKQFFVDWILEGGYERVCICAVSKNDEKAIHRCKV